MENLQSLLELGCCGACCKTCHEFMVNCKGCKIGYTSGERNIDKARCKIKICCINKEYNSCADCSSLKNCSTINSFYSKNGYKYRKYQESIMYIKQNGYETFFKISEKWKNAYGKFK